ncbi:MAG: hypothetical protein NT023_17170 [Armatimonadetes bacterium]|nr:hypothetical protein [Armatimonadota bacterium]
MRKSRFNLRPAPVLLPTAPKRESSLCVIAVEGEKDERAYFRKFGSDKSRSSRYQR